jgi:site-specific recombinase XerD
MDLAREIEEFLEYLEIERNCSLLTIRDYRHYLEKFLDWSNDNYPIHGPKDVNLDCIRKYRLFLSRYSDGKGLTLKKVTQNYYVIALRAFLRYLVKKDLPVLAPEKIELPKTESRSLKFLDRDQLDRLLNSPEISTPQGLRDKALLEMLFSTGLRVSELVKLNRDQINLERREFGVIGKGQRQRVVFLSDRAVEWLERYLASRQDAYKPLFIRYAGNHDGSSGGEKMRLTCRSVERIVKKYVKKAKIPIDASCHTIRHSYATDLLINGADLRSVQKLLGHKNIAATQIYTHVTNQQLREVHKAFHSGNK